MTKSLHPQAQALLDAPADPQARPWHELSAVEAHAAHRKAMGALCGETMPGIEIENRIVPKTANTPDVPVRIYTPGGTAPRPVVIFYHGGGFVLGGLDIYDALCSRLAHGSKAVVVSVDYRLAPQHKFPAAPDDCLAVAHWVYDNADELNIDRDRVALAGDSAGANLATVTCHALRDEGQVQPCLQVLMYPMIDGVTETQSRLRCGSGYRYTQLMDGWFYDHYLRTPADHNDPRVSPLRAASCAGLPPALVITAGFDPLCDEGEAYAARLRDDGVAVELVRFDDMMHGFCNMMGALDRGAEAIDLCCSHLAAAFKIQNGV